MICSRLKQKKNQTKHWYGPSILSVKAIQTCIYSSRKYHIYDRWNTSSTEDRLPPVNHPLQRSPTWASTVRTGDKVFRAASLLWASQAEVAVAVGDHWAVWCFLGWKKKKRHVTKSGIHAAPVRSLGKTGWRAECKLMCQWYEMLYRSCTNV